MDQVTDNKELKNDSHDAPQIESETSENGSSSNGKDLPAKNDEKPSPKVSKKSLAPTKTLPPSRLRVDNQLMVLSYYASLSVGGKVGVSVNQVADMTDKAASTLSSFNAFFKETGFLISKEGQRGFYPCKELLDYTNQLSSSINKGDAIKALQPVIQESWFGKLIMQMVNSGTKPNDNTLMSKLAIFVETPLKGRELQFTQLIEWCDKTGLIVKQEDGTYLMGNISSGDNGGDPGKGSEGNETPQPIKRVAGGYDDLLEALNNTTFGLKELKILGAEGFQDLIDATTKLEKIIKQLKGAETKKDEN